VEDLDREVLTALAENLLHLLAKHLARAMVGIDDVVPNLELDEWNRLSSLEILFQVLFR
jgi:hypothetical protein